MYLKLSTTTNPLICKLNIQNTINSPDKLNRQQLIEESYQEFQKSTAINLFCWFCWFVFVCWFFFLLLIKHHSERQEMSLLKVTGAFCLFFS